MVISTCEQSADSEPPGPVGRKLYQYVATGAAVFPALQVGIGLGWTSTMLPYLSSEESSITITDDESGWITSLVSIGALIGSLPTGKIADWIGRKKSIQLSGIFYLFCWTTMLVATNVWTLYAARILGGIGMGSTCVLSLMYVGEITEKSVRGALASLFAVLISCGLFCTYSLGAVLSFNEFSWFCLGHVIVLFGLSFLLIESPIWLMSLNREIEAREALIKLRGAKYNIDHEITEIRSQLLERKNKAGGFKDLIKTRAGRRAIVIGIGLMIFQQVSGIDAILAYTVSIFQAAGSSINSYLATGLIGLVQVIMAVITAVVIEKLGRRLLLIMSGTSMVICLGILGLYFRLKNSGIDVTSFGWLPLVALICFNCTFSLGFGSISWTMISEIFPPETKAVASSISLAIGWVIIFLVTKLYPIIVKYFDESIAFWIFSSFMVCATIFVIFLVPETKGKSLAQIQFELGGRKEKGEKRKSITENQQSVNLILQGVQISEGNKILNTQLV